MLGGAAPAVVRLARPDDIEAVIELGARLHGTSRYRGLPYDRVALRARLADALDRPDRYFVAVGDHDGAIIAVLAGYLTTFVFCAVPLAMDACFYVDPDWREMAVASHLLENFEGWARERGAPCVVLGVTSGIADERAVRLYRHLGYTTMGTVLIRRV